MDLLFACMGNGITVCDKEQNYRDVCHISIHGHVQFYTEKENLPSENLDRIFAEAERERTNFLIEWEKKSTAAKYSYMMDVPTIGFGYNAFTKVAHESRHLPMEELVRKMEEVFFETHM